MGAHNYLPPKSISAPATFYFKSCNDSSSPSTYQLRDLRASRDPGALSQPRGSSKRAARPGEGAPPQRIPLLPQTEPRPKGTPGSGRDIQPRPKGLPASRVRSPALRRNLCPAGCTPPWQGRCSPPSWPPPAPARSPRTEDSAGRPDRASGALPWLLPPELLPRAGNRVGALPLQLLPHPLTLSGSPRTFGPQRDLNSFLWTIRRNPPAYLFGTIHVPYTRVWDFIPDNSKAAFQASARVYFELDLTDPYTISALASCQLLPHGENLQDVLPRELYWRLKRHLDYVKLMMPSWMTPAQRGKGLYADYLFNAIAGNWERKRPVWVMLMVNSLTETDVRSRGVPVLDLYLAQQAEKMKKSTGAVERVEEQCHPLNGLNFSQALVQISVLEAISRKE
ncbi:metalloprotease TIKI2-like [Bubalus kerabau]|uniref:metalloprotease TIKI2-like n=1 Tax=Bubalus carabanensis TaxID=3119969 RepID=UPI00244EB438|nr:metalloprotease TIKI2-like [Bubalus carabanensis]